MTWSALSKLLGVVATLFGTWLLYRVLSRYEAAEILGAVSELGVFDFALAIIFTLVSFAFLVLGEWAALVYADKRPGWNRITLTTIAALGIGHAIGMAAVSSAAIRYRMYRPSGVHLLDLGKVMLFSGLTAMAGMTTVGGIALLAQPHSIATMIDLEIGQIRMLGAALLASTAGYLALCALHLRAIRIGKLSLAPPRLRLAGVQLLAGVGNYAAVVGCLYACVRPFAEADYPTVATLYVGADAAALIGHVPGGWGVLEYVLTAALDQPHLIAGILVFRTIYYLVPLFIGLAVFLQDEVRRLRTRATRGEDSHPSGAAAGLRG